MSGMSVLSWSAAALFATALPAFSQQFTLPDGPGKQLVENSCGGCHPISRLGAGYAPEGWRTVVHMMQNMEVPVPPEQWPVVTEYLIKSFPEKPKPAAAVLQGPIHAAIKLWP